MIPRRGQRGEYWKGDACWVFDLIGSELGDERNLFQGKVEYGGVDIYDADKRRVEIDNDCNYQEEYEKHGYIKCKLRLFAPDARKI